MRLLCEAVEKPVIPRPKAEGSRLRFLALRARNDTFSTVPYGYIIALSLVFVFPAFSNGNGKDLFIQKCASCHTVGGGGSIGPDLKGVRERSQAWLLEFIKSPRAMIEKKDERALGLVAEYGLIMPDSDLSDEEIQSILAYIKAAQAEIEAKKPVKRVHMEVKKLTYDQPIDFSHKIHAGDYKIPCLYCHSGAQKSRHAGIPSANVCLNCHSQIKVDSPEVQKIHTAIREQKPLVWFKRHDFPDHAYFSHSRHVNADIRCQTCHGEIETMAKPVPIKITMGWCVSCHRDADKKMISQSSEMPKYHMNFTKLDCARCHH